MQAGEKLSCPGNHVYLADFVNLSTLFTPDCSVSCTVTYPSAGCCSRTPLEQSSAVSMVNGKIKSWWAPDAGKGAYDLLSTLPAQKVMIL